MSRQSPDTIAQRAAVLHDQYQRLSIVGERAKALDVLEQAASLGAVYAIHDLAYHYYNEVPDRKTDALKLYKKSVRLGEGASAWNIALHYKSLNNTRYYKYWMRVAADMGITEAIDAMEVSRSPLS